MKIGFLGNTNNYPYIIASQMRDLGCEVILFVDAPPSETLHRPEHYSSKVSYPYPSWIRENLNLRNSIKIHFPQFFLRDVLKEINSCDAVILNDYGHRMRNHIDKKVISISMFSGVDLEVMADYDNVREMVMNNPVLKSVPSFIKKAYAHFSVSQLRRGIALSSLVSYFPEGINPVGDKILKQVFGNKPFKRFAHFHVITDGFSYATPPDNDPFRIFSFTRFIWKMPLPAGRTQYENKGNDIMIKGIALFLKRTGKKLDIHFIEKGIHLKESKELIEELGFSEMVTWHSEMPFKALKNHIDEADVLMEQTGNHYISGGFYAMLEGRPVIGNARPEIFEPLLKEPTAICHALTPEQVCDWLVKLSSDKEFLHAKGRESRAYTLRHYDIMNETKYFKSFLEGSLQQLS